VPDLRFFDALAPLTVGDLADRIGGRVVRGAERRIAAVAPLSSATADDIAFLSDRKLADRLATSGAGCVIVAGAFVDQAPLDAAVIESGEPQAAGIHPPTSPRS